jgi:hypothetical protein
MPCMAELDTQQTELVGRSWLEARLIRAGFEVARPARDRGIDLIAFGDTATEPFWACPIQVKAASVESFSLDRKYADRGIVMAYVWQALSAEPRLYLVPYDDAVTLLGAARDTKSWQEEGRWAVTRPSVSLKAALEPFHEAFHLLRRSASTPNTG